MQQETGHRCYLAFLSVLFFGVLIWSALNPKDYFTWILEVAPGIGGFIVLGLTYRRFRFTNFVYTLMLMQCLILFVGGHYTYAEVPLFDRIRELVGGTRNNYDKVGHFAQGFVPAMMARELILRLNVTKSRAWTNYFAVSSALAISALYELIEWWTALLTGESAEAFLGTQGYVWDTQSDMLLALIGSVMAVALFSRYHDAKMKEIGGSIDVSLEKHG
jgi:putative membrane protein